jgi:proteasome lid subunit RPN8/RPN11
VDLFQYEDLVTSSWQRWIRSTMTQLQHAANQLNRPPSPIASRNASANDYQPLMQLVITDEVCRVLFAEYEAHRNSTHGDEETGWVLLGHREVDRAIVLATLPAGAERDAGREHVRFNSEAQAVASRIVRQHDKRLTLLGVAHTHPGTLRHPSHGDFRGDREWVRNLRGHQGVFAIGTAEKAVDATLIGEHPQPHVQTLGGLRFDWYTLADGEKTYRPLAVELTIGPDLALPLRSMWSAIEAHAAALGRLARQLQGVTFTANADHVLVTIGEQVRLIVREKTVRFVADIDGNMMQAELPSGTQVDQGVYLLLAELASRAH